ncbi:MULTISPECIES: 3-deoxy-manno-octulosonate cytidylyltransferase [Bacillaceae]|jgi:3-deoxy-manno-octulosonate cytidylyltransferase (CMP-KDO synthetase)|uniref:3-deoxy-manno-octulosonate cytidylyltransferase n=1 Tax=Gottfriedia luciferensis TaxID=178774 RepID=A0ABX2ZQI1_9BACI|nr:MULTISPECIES: 3-deoxy-manno-octulosonate cytidylyltransferase [Bacillaceae]ODG92011.1 3-deoxy-manno-octulosonate cytidylyltransferase [Gottfriedia luciferensis]PGZ87565.1 3-deoxy-manno-octulosonate cytidylyltransferase [Bacillus sp. AFS029533]SFD17627.1 3-deoxy-manno-octulosonate cytidylyltransferase (CMP-KDO synthetase) [Bacillus sp. UNCCL81]
MKIIGVIPARYNSSRFPGKPLADICGKPMIWWVHERLKGLEGLNEVYVATDDLRIKEVCESYGIKTIMTSENHKTHLDRLYEVSTLIDADFYINVNGDEPLIETEAISRILPNGVDPNSLYVSNLMTELKNPLEAVDFSKIKIATDVFGYGLYLARSPIPYPKGTYDFYYKKFVGVQCFTKSALEFCYSAPRGPLEAAEDIDEFRFIENGQKIKFVEANVTTLSVDTPKDLDKVRDIIKDRLESVVFE